MQSVFVILVHWIVIYPVDSAIQLLNNRARSFTLVYLNITFYNYCEMIV